MALSRSKPATTLSIIFSADARTGVAGHLNPSRCKSRQQLAGRFNRNSIAMRSPKSLVVAAALAFLLGVWLIFWALSDSLLNIVRCENDYSLFSSLPYCRRPVILEIFGFVSVGGSLLLAVRAWRYRLGHTIKPPSGQLKRVAESGHAEVLDCVPDD